MIEKLNLNFNNHSTIVESALQNKINEIIDFVNTLIPMKTPNIGETPEVDNTEGQAILNIYDITQIKAALKFVKTNGKSLYTNGRIKELMSKIENLNSKPVETE